MIGVGLLSFLGQTLSFRRLHACLKVKEGKASTATLFEIMDDLFLFDFRSSLQSIFCIVDDVLPHLKVGISIFSATLLLIPCFCSRVAGEKQLNHFFYNVLFCLLLHLHVFLTSLPLPFPNL